MSDEEDPDFDQVWQGEKVDRKDNLMNNIDKMTHVLLKPMYALLTVLGVALVILGIGAPFVFTRLQALRRYVLWAKPET